MSTPVDVTFLLVSPGVLNTQQIESRAEIDSSKYTFTVTNVTTSLVTLINVKLYLIFDFTNQNLTINGVSKSTPDDPLIIAVTGEEGEEGEVGELLPAIPYPVEVDIVANVGGKPTPKSPPITGYVIPITATYDIKDVIEPVEISGGVIAFDVVAD